MKNLITFCVVSVLATLFLTSCGSSLQITKRHYTKGFYISSNRVKSSKTASGDIEKKEKENKEVVEADNILESNVLSIKETGSTNTMTTDKEISSVISLPEAITEPFEVEQSSAQNPSESIPDVIINTASNVKYMFSKTKLKTSHSSNEGFSLLWIVIVVLLILWLLGFISGYAATNAIIHLLLLIALILLILWLLRVI